MKVFKDFKIVGKKEKIESFFDHIAKEMNDGKWERKPDMDDESSAMEEKFIIFLRNKDEDIIDNATIFFYLEADNAEIVNIVPEKIGELGIGIYNKIIDEFSAKFVKPFCEEYGIEIQETDGIFDLKKVLSETTYEYLRSFSGLANKSTGSSHPMDRERWMKFIISVYKNSEENKIDTHMLERWLIEDEGWSERKTSDLITEFEFAQELLKTYHMWKLVND